MPKLTSEAIKDRARQHGADIVGVASASSLEKEPKGYRPSDLVPGARSVVSVGIRQLRAYLENAPSTTYFMYGYRQKNDYINEIVSDIAQLLDGAGYAALPVPPWGSGDLSETVSAKGKKAALQMRGIFSHANAAAAAGLGEVGLSGMFLSSEYGPRVHLGSIITTAPLTADGGAAGSLCDRAGCRACVKACSASAIAADGSFDPVACIVAVNKLATGYEETKKQILERQEKVDPLRRAASAVGYSDFVGLGFCGLGCINACPVGKKDLK
jgi:epoxyqueuosine reductase